jgi:hypothetical protein
VRLEVAFNQSLKKIPLPGTNGGASGEAYAYKKYDGSIVLIDETLMYPAQEKSLKRFLMIKSFEIYEINDKKRKIIFKRSARSKEGPISIDKEVVL